MVNGTITRKDWLITAVLLVLSCLMRNNIVYAIAALAVFSVVFYKRNPQGECFLYISVVVLYFIINNGFIIALDAGKGSVAEALSVPCQQIARLYVEEGEEVFDSEEQELLYAAIEPEVLLTYDPVISDPIKYALGSIGMQSGKIGGNMWRHGCVRVCSTRKYIGIPFWIIHIRHGMRALLRRTEADIDIFI